MGPTSENAGYAQTELTALIKLTELQWVRRPRTPVMSPYPLPGIPEEIASMGPTSENAGYERLDRWECCFIYCFNGSDVRERRLCR